VKKHLILKLHLIISCLVVVPVAVIYGFHPNLLLEMDFLTHDEQNFAKAVMGLYLAFALFWAFGIMNKSYLKSAIVSNCIFMLGLALGRLLSVFIDGWPSAFFSLGIFGELILGLYGLFVMGSQPYKKLN
jgi:hypothetical protein